MFISCGVSSERAPLTEFKKLKGNLSIAIVIMTTIKSILTKAIIVQTILIRSKQWLNKSTKLFLRKKQLPQ